MQSRFFWRLYSSYVAIVVLAVATAGVLVGRRISNDSLLEVEESLRVRAVLLGEVASQSSHNFDSLQVLVTTLGESIRTRLTVMTADGTVIADSDRDPSTMDNHAERPEVLAAAAEGSGTSTRFSRTVVQRMMYHALAWRDGGRLLGFVRSAVPLTAIEERLSDLRWVIISAGLIVTLVALVLGLLVTRRVTAPLLSMTDAAEAIAGGMYSERVETGARDEIGKLSRAFNKMASELENRIASVTEDRGRLLAVLSGMVEGVVAVDRELRILHLNASAERILDLEAASSIGKPIWEVTRFRKVNETVERALNDATEVTGEICLRQEARDRIVELHAAPLRDGSPDPRGAVLVLHEVTQLRRLETVRQDFVANVSHELKTPITAIRGLVETILDDNEMHLDIRTRFLNKVQDQSMRLSLLVTDLLTLSRLESEDGGLQRDDLSFQDLVMGSVRNLQSTADAKEVSLIAEIPHDPVQIFGDWDALELVVNNLLDNALKYTPTGGSVSVELRAENDTAIVVVKDTGIGINPEHHDRIFERFYRVDKARSRELGGTGLGLSIVKHICKAHNGTVSVESVPGAGATFTVRLPITSERTSSMDVTNLTDA